MSRRGFLKLSGQATTGISLSFLIFNLLWKERAEAVIPAAGGYVVVDQRKCQGCLTCMLACSLAHDGVHDLSGSRIQILQNPLSPFPEDISIAPCLQCNDAPCVEACPTGALAPDPIANQSKRVDGAKCIGCKACLKACPFEPVRLIWNNANKQAEICDLCLQAPHFKSTGADGEQACIAACPTRAIQLARLDLLSGRPPRYEVNLRGDGWKKLGYNTR